MSARAGRRRRFEEEAEHDGSERWLLTYADMITLLMALFIVMFAMSSVNETKFDSLQKSLQEAFSGKILGGESIKQTGGSVQAEESTPSVSQTTIAPMAKNSPLAKHEQEDFRKLKIQIDRLIAQEGLSSRVESTIEKRGLAVRVLTDGLLFESGSADVRPAAEPTLRKLAKVLSIDKSHPFRVEGHTDNVPVHGRYPSNWELSTARSSAVVRSFTGTGHIPAARFEAVGRADLEPLAPNATETGRSKNRRVEIILPRRHAEPAPETPREAVASAIRPDITTTSSAREATR